MPHFEFSALTLLLAQIAAIMVVSRLLGVGAKAIGQPLVMAEVLAGILLGPSLLGWLWPDAMGVLFPRPSMPILQMLAQVGLVLFMFLIGLELDPKLLKGRTHSSVLISHTSIIVPFALGFAAAFWLWESYSSPEIPFTSFALFLGTAMSITAFPVLARILSERRLMNSRVGAITIACAAVDDVTAWCILAFVVSLVRAHDLLSAVWTTGMALLFILGMVFLVRPFLRRLGARVATREGLTPTVVAVILLLLIASASITEMIGIHALFGAFLFGAILPKEGQLAETLAEKLETVAVIMLLPIFFAYSGLRTEIGLVSRPHDWMVAVALIVLATAGKFGGSAIAARITGLKWRESSAIGILMNTRGLMELIVLNIGLDLGVISPTIFTMLVIMALVTTFSTTPILRLVYPDAELARDRIEPATAPAGGPAPFTVLTCVTDATIAPALATLVARLAGKPATDAQLLGLHLRKPSDRATVKLLRGESLDDTGPLEPLVRRARELGVDIKPLSFISPEPAADICRTADAKQASLVVLGSHKPLLFEGRLGGVVRDVIECAKCPVAVLRDRGLAKLDRVLIAFAGGPEDLAALRLARRIGQSPGTQLTMLHVVKPGHANQPGPGREQLSEQLGGAPGTGTQEFAQEDLDSNKLHVRLVEHESPPEAVLEEAARGYDLVVIGMNSKWGLTGGTISIKRQRVLAESPVSVLAVHPSNPEPDKQDSHCTLALR